MAGIHRRTDNDRRKSSDFYDRRDDRRDDRDRPFDYRDRTSDRFHRSPREPPSRRGSYERDDSVRSRDRDLERDRDKDLRPSREQPGKSLVDRPTSNKLINASDQGGTPGQRIQVREAKNIAQILSVGVHYRTQLEIVEKKLENIKADENRLSIKPAEFGSAGDMLRNKIQETENKRAKFQQEVDAADAMLQTALNALLKKQQPTSSDGKLGAQSPQKQSIGSISGLEARLMELQKSTVSLFNTQLNVELGKVQESAKGQADSNSSEVEELRKSLEEEKRKNQLLEQRLDKLERKFEGTRSGTDMRFSAMEQKSSTMAQKLSTAEQKLSTDAQALSELRQLAEAHTKQLTDMKSIASLPSKPSTSDKQFRASIAEQDRKMSTLRDQLDPALAEIRQLKETSKSQAPQYFTSKDGSEVVAEVVRLKQLLKLHTTAMEKHDQKQGSLAADISSLHSSTKLQQQKQESLEGIVKSLESAVKREQQKGGSLAAEVSSLHTTMSKWPTEELRQFIAEAPSAKDLKQLLSDLPPARDLAQLLTELPPASGLKQLMEELPPASDLRQLMEELPPPKDLTRLLAELPPASGLKQLMEELPPASGLRQLMEELPPPKDLAQLLTELPPASDLKRLIEELPPPQDLTQLLAELPPAKDLAQLLAELPPASGLKQLMTELPPIKDLKQLARGSPRPVAARSSVDPGSFEAPMTEKKVLQTVAPKFEEIEKALEADMASKFTMVATKFGLVIDETRASTKKIGDSVTELDKRLSSVSEDMETRRKGVAEIAENLDQRLKQQGAEANGIKGAVASLGREIEMVRNHSKAGMEDLQMQLTHMTEWANHLSTKNWYKEVVQQIQAHIPTHVHSQLEHLSSRVGVLENRDNDLEAANKRRKVANGSPVVINGNH